MILLTQKVQLTAGIYAAKALVQHLCKRFNDPENGHIFIPDVSILSRRIFCVQEVLLYMCLLYFNLNALFGLTNECNVSVTGITKLVTKIWRAFHLR
jgi:hypothetical protein